MSNIDHVQPAADVQGSPGTAIWVIYTFSITEEKAHEVRTELERRRGAPRPGAVQPA